MMQVAKSAPVRLIFPSGEIAVRRALASFGQTLRRQGVCAQDRGTVELALGEVLNNVVEHAYGPGQPGQIEVIGDLRGNAMAFYVRDSGRALGALRVPEGRLANHAVQRDDLPEGGWGCFLVRELAQALDYRRVGCHNELRFVVPLTRRGGCAPVKSGE